VASVAAWTIQHQRGQKAFTDVGRVLELCDLHWDESDFFVAKAIGWALRDLARLDLDGVLGFITAHSDTNRIGLREARRGLGRR
jgi:3-methyladenine DNA glycosylase AlkD